MAPCELMDCTLNQKKASTGDAEQTRKTPKIRQRHPDNLEQELERSRTTQQPQELSEPDKKEEPKPHGQKRTENTCRTNQELGHNATEF